jgi:aspartyl protease family protein
MNELPHSFKIWTVWLVVMLAVFLGFKAFEHQREASRFRVEGAEVVLQRAPDGHFHWPARVNGVPVDFLVDTGATSTALPKALAERLRLEAIGSVRTETAGGAVRASVAKVDLALDGGVTVERLPVTVLPDLSGPLLGMDVLGHLHFSQGAGELRIQGRER